MNDIPFGKFFDTKDDYELIAGMGLVKSETYLESVIYLFKNKKDNQCYVVLEEEHGGDIERELEAWLGNHEWILHEIPPKNPNLYALPFTIARVTFTSN
jgi:hypothetical protein